MRRDAGIYAAALLASISVRPAAAQNGGFQWQTLGATTYDTVCAACHQPTGAGVPGTFPPLSGHAPAVLARPGGRAYLARLVLYGLGGEISVDGKTFNSSMPPLGETLNDEQLAAALDQVLRRSE